MFDEKMDCIEEMVVKYFDEEYVQIQSQITLLINLLTQNMEQIKIVFEKMKVQFKENLSQMKQKFLTFDNDREECTIFINILVFKLVNDYLGKDNMTPNDNFSEVKSFLFQKNRLEKDYEDLKSYYILNKKSLNDEFTLDEYKNYLSRNTEFLQKYFKDNDKKFNDSEFTILSRINNTTINKHKSNLTVSNDNIIPCFSNCIYQPIERTNLLIEYNIDDAVFRKQNIRPDIGGADFNFFKFSRSINFNGRIITTGGVNINKITKRCWIIENKNNFLYLDKNLINDLDNISQITSIPKENIYYDTHESNLVYYEAQDMIFPHAGHSVTNYYPYLMIVIGGVEDNDKCEMYDIRTNNWKQLPDMTKHRIDPTSVIYKDYLYVFFGLCFSNISKKASYTDKIERLKLTSDAYDMRWEKITPVTDENNPIAPRSLCGVSFQNSNTIYLFGGLLKKDTYSDDIIKFNFETSELKKDEKKLFKKTVFIESKFNFNGQKSTNFDFNGDIFMYFPKTDNFGFQFSNLETQSKKI